MKTIAELQSELAKAEDRVEYLARSRVWAWAETGTWAKALANAEAEVKTIRAKIRALKEKGHENN